MKILQIITRPDQGGAQNHVLDLALGLSEHEIVVGTGKTGWLTREINSPSIIFKRLNRSLNPLAAILYIFELRQHLKRHRYDILHFHSSNSLFGVLAARGLKPKLKTLATLHGLSILHPGWQKSRLVKMIYARAMKFLLKYFDKIIFVCEADKKFALQTKLVRPEQAVVIYNGINSNINFWPRPNARTQLGLPDDLFVIGTVARLEYAKNLDLTLAIADKLRGHDLLFAILGHGPERARLSQKIAKQKLDNVLLSNCFPAPRALLKAFDVFLMTSRYEGLPYTLLEAGLAELPIISTNAGGISEILDQVHAADPDRLARQILVLKESASVFRDRGKQKPDLREKILTQFSQDKMLTQISSLYDKTMA